MNHTGEIYSGDLLLDDALIYLDEQGKADTPLFLHLAIQQPHADISVPDEFRTGYIGEFDEKPLPSGGYISEPYTAATYAGMITYIDHTVRRVLQIWKRPMNQRNLRVSNFKQDGLPG